MNKIKAYEKAISFFNIDRNSSKKNIKKRYKELALKYHPDHNNNSIKSNILFKIIKYCHDVLLFDQHYKELLDTIKKYDNEKDNLLDNNWGYFLWWKNKFNNTNTNNMSVTNRRSCI
ncbi:MAG: J domain-containing protein [archaeon]